MVDETLIEHLVPLVPSPPMELVSLAHEIYDLILEVPCKLLHVIELSLHVHIGFKVQDLRPVDDVLVQAALDLEFDHLIVQGPFTELVSVKQLETDVFLNLRDLLFTFCGGVGYTPIH
jgi:hypothetical protein